MKRTQGARNFPPDMLAQCARRESARCRKVKGQAGFLFLGAPRVDCGFLFVHTHWGGRFMGLNKVLMVV